MLRRSLLPTDATLIRAEAVLERMVEFADRAVRRNDPAMRWLLTQIASIASEILDGFPVEFWRIAEDRDGVFPSFGRSMGILPSMSLARGRSPAVAGVCAHQLRQVLRLSVESGRTTGHHDH